MRPAVLDYLAGSDHIIHAGDIGDAAILEALAALAPLTAVRGNNDTDTWADGLAETADLTIGGVRVHVIHDIAMLDPAHGADAVICGHSHRPRVEHIGESLQVNPGSAGRRRFRLPICAGCLWIAGAGIEPEIRHFDPD